MPLDGGGFGYTALVIDAFAGLITGWECSLSKETAFVERAIRQAAARRRREGRPLPATRSIIPMPDRKLGFRGSSQHLFDGGVVYDDAGAAAAGPVVPGADSFSRSGTAVAWREDRVRILDGHRAGRRFEDAARRSACRRQPGPAGFARLAGWLPKPPPAVSGRYLSFAEREEIAIWRAQNGGVREIGRRLGRSPSTISRELRRNASTRTWRLDYRARRRGGMPSGGRAVQDLRSWPLTSGCASMCRSGCPG